MSKDDLALSVALLRDQEYRQGSSGMRALNPFIAIYRARFPRSISALAVQYVDSGISMISIYLPIISGLFLTAEQKKPSGLEFIPLNLTLGLFFQGSINGGHAIFIFYSFIPAWPALG
ncbi:hypothetical protein V8C37DRAFT_297734 [Trichoderma ceciliae]